MQWYLCVCVCVVTYSGKAAGMSDCGGSILLAVVKIITRTERNAPSWVVCALVYSNSDSGINDVSTVLVLIVKVVVVVVANSSSEMWRQWRR